MALRDLMVVTALVALPLPTVALAAQDETVAADGKAEDPGDKLVCKSKRDHRTGSNMRMGRECRTAAEWKERERAAQRELTRLRDKQQTPGLGLGR